MLLSSAAGIVPLAVLGACTTVQISNWTTFVDQVIAIVAKGCGLAQGYIPTVNTILAVVTALYPTIGAAVTAGATAVEAVASALCSAIPANPPASFTQRLAKATAGAPIVIGTITVNGKPVVVHGYSAR
jgi:hypothetical protein